MSAEVNLKTLRPIENPIMGQPVFGLLQTGLRKPEALPVTGWPDGISRRLRCLIAERNFSLAARQRRKPPACRAPEESIRDRLACSSDAVFHAWGAYQPRLDDEIGFVDLRSVYCPIAPLSSHTLLSHTQQTRCRDQKALSCSAPSPTKSVTT